jgi:hypothetical protein
MQQCQQPVVLESAANSGQDVAWAQTSRPLLPVLQRCLPAVTNAQVSPAPARILQEARVPQEQHQQQLMLRQQEMRQQTFCHNQ